jgi:hypothetical protein
VPIAQGPELLALSVWSRTLHFFIKLLKVGFDPVTLCLRQRRKNLIQRLRPLSVFKRFEFVSIHARWIAQYGERTERNGYERERERSVCMLCERLLESR